MVLLQTCCCCDLPIIQNLMTTIHAVIFCPLQSVHICFFRLFVLFSYSWIVDHVLFIRFVFRSGSCSCFVFDMTGLPSTFSVTGKQDLVGSLVPSPPVFFTSPYYYMTKGWTKNNWQEWDLNLRPPGWHAGTLLPTELSSPNVGGPHILSVYLFRGASQKQVNL